jgi:hypothetical protein
MMQSTRRSGQSAIHYIAESKVTLSWRRRAAKAMPRHQNAIFTYSQRALNGNIARGMVFFCSSSIEITPLFGV